MPGYTGYVPKVSAQNIIGSTFRRANERATFGECADGERHARRSGSPKGSQSRGDIDGVPRKKHIGCTDHISEIRKAPLQRSVSCNLFDGVGLPYGRESLGEIPSYIDHVPRRAGANLKSEEGFGCPLGREVTAEIPSYIEHVPRKNRKGRPEYMHAQWDSINQPGPRGEQTREEADAKPSTSKARSASPRLDRQAIPGYAGHVRKVVADNVFGVSFKTAGECADGDEDTDLKREHPWLTSPNANARSAGKSIPGYAGYIPRKGPDGVLGATFKAANDRASEGFDPVTEAPTEATRLQDCPSKDRIAGAGSRSPGRPTRLTTGGGKKSESKRAAWR
jgi:hypothetical protein